MLIARRPANVTYVSNQKIVSPVPWHNRLPRNFNAKLLRREYNMRIVPNLNDTKECPNCGCHMLYGPIEDSESPTKRMFKLCTICNEEIYESETTISEEKTMTDNFDRIHYCPKCLSNKLTTVTDIRSGIKYKHCNCCGHKIYPSEEESRPSTQKTNNDEWVSPSKKKEDFIFEMREEISHLDWCSHDLKTQTLVENIQNILNKIIDYIEEN